MLPVHPSDAVMSNARLEDDYLMDKYQEWENYR